jgi:hypothetical protein
VAFEEQPVRRLGSGYSWRKPFLRRPPSTPAGLEEVSAKKCNAPISDYGIDISPG